MNNRHIIACALNEYGEGIKITDDSPVELKELRTELSMISLWISLNKGGENEIAQGILKILSYCEKLSSHDCYKNLVEKVERAIKVYQHENQSIDKEKQYQETLKKIRQFNEHT